MKIATCQKRNTLVYKNQDVTWEQLTRKLQTTKRTAETVAEYKNMTKDQQADIKDVGGFVAGELKQGRRNNQSVISRSMVTLDADFASQDFITSIELAYGNRCCIYSTHKHTPEHPKLRWIVPLNREVTPDEYEAIARRVAEFIGLDQFDDTTYQPARMMFWPSTSADGEYIFKNIGGLEVLDADAVLATYRDWTDISTWPRSSRETDIHKNPAKKQEDPLTKTGWIGAFCRTYTIQEAIEKFIPDEYTPTAADNRWTYTKGSTAGGLVIYDDKFAYSNHSTDPASQQLCNAFDLVRLHKFPEADGQEKMLEFASQDPDTKKTLAHEKQQEAMSAWDEESDTKGQDLQKDDKNKGNNAETERDSDWVELLETDKKGNISPTTDNIVKIMTHDPKLKNGIGGNDLFQQKPVKAGDLPWWSYDDNNTWSDTDDAGLRYYLEKSYKVVAKGKTDDAVAFVQERDSFHPVRDYLNSLTWDHQERLDNMFIDYLGAEDSAYNKAVARKIMTAAVARVFTPGCKMDYMPVLVGKQGIGKSHMLSILGGEWFSDSITNIQGKEGYEALHGSWIVEWAELSAARKADIESMKQFISKRDDRYRKAYARRVTDNPRQCVFIGTTNDDEFLRDYTGNRRFWPVQTNAGLATKSVFEDLPKERDQLWAEAMERFRQHEPLYLDSELQAKALEVQEEHTYRSVREDIVRDYLAKKLPKDWNEMDLFTRKNWLANPDSEGTETREKVCLLEIWCEVFEGNKTGFNNQDQRELKAIMNHIGWPKGGAPRQMGTLYGKQRCYLNPEFTLERFQKDYGNTGNGDTGNGNGLETVTN